MTSIITQVRWVCGCKRSRGSITGLTAHPIVGHENEARAKGRECAPHRNLLGIGLELGQHYPGGKNPQGGEDQTHDPGVQAEEEIKRLVL